MILFFKQKSPNIIDYFQIIFKNINEKKNNQI